MKRVWSLLLVLALCMGLAGPAAAAPTESGILIGGKELALSAPAQVMDGVLMIPVRAVAQALQADVAWDGATETVTITSAQHKVSLTVGQAQAVVNGNKVQLSNKMTKVGGTNYVPASFLATFFGPKLAITHPEARNAKAMELLTSSKTATDVDMALKMKANVSDQSMSMGITMTGDAQVRGEEMLMAMVLSIPMMPEQTMQMALKDGRLFMQMDKQAWEGGSLGLGMSINPEQLPLALGVGAEDGAKALLEKFILEAYLGESRKVGEATLQDVVFIYDLGGILDFVAAMMGEEISAEDMAELMEILRVEDFRAIITIDTATGFMVGMKAQFAGALKMDEMAARLEFIMEATMTPNETPITWTADLLEAEQEAIEFEKAWAELQAELEALEAELNAEGEAGTEGALESEVQAEPAEELPAEPVAEPAA